MFVANRDCYQPAHVFPESHEYKVGLINVISSVGI